MNDKKNEEHHPVDKRKLPRPEKITKWEGETREQKRHKEMLKKVNQWEREGYHFD